VQSGFRDNAVYLAGYQSLVVSNGISPNYLKFQIMTGASEPLSFLFFYFGKYVSLDYDTLMNLKIILFSLAISLMLSVHVRRSLLVFFACIYISTDYYLLRLFSELHRIGLAIIFILFAWHIFRHFKSVILISMLFHVQAIFFIVFQKLSKRDLLLAGLLAAVGSIYVFPVFQSKFLYYLRLDVKGAVSIIVIYSVFIASSMRWPRDLFTQLSLGTAAVVFFASFLGSDRLLFTVWEVLIAVSFWAYQKRLLDMRNFGYFAGLIFFAVVPYNLFRTYTFLNEAGVI
jgi:hypothetical protein